MLQAQILTVRAEGSHIMPGNQPAAETSGPDASLRAPLLLGRSLVLGERKGGRLQLKRNPRLAQLIFQKQEAHQAGTQHCPEGTRWEGSACPHHTFGVSFLLWIALDA